MSRSFRLILPLTEPPGSDDDLPTDYVDAVFADYAHLLTAPLPAAVLPDADESPAPASPPTRPPATLDNLRIGPPVPLRPPRDQYSHWYT